MDRAHLLRHHLWADPITVMFLHGDSSLEFLALSSLVVVCAIAAAAFSYYVVERRFLRLKNPRPRRSRAREPVPQQVGEAPPEALVR